MMTEFSSEIAASSSENVMQIGNQTVYFGNSEHMDAIPANTINLIITSPPYWNLKKYGQKSAQIGHSNYETYLERLD